MVIGVLWGVGAVVVAVYMVCGPSGSRRAAP